MVQFEYTRVIHPLVSFTFEVNCGRPFSLDAGKGKCCMWLVKNDIPHVFVGHSNPEAWLRDCCSLLSRNNVITDKAGTLDALKGAGYFGRGLLQQGRPVARTRCLREGEMLGKL